MLELVHAQTNLTVHGGHAAHVPTRDYARVPVLEVHARRPTVPVAVCVCVCVSVCMRACVCIYVCARACVLRFKPKRACEHRMQ